MTAGYRMKINNYYAKITGRGYFPIDMLRRDSCSPASEVDSGVISETFKKHTNWTVFVKCRTESKTPWTVGRWESFGCKIEEVTTAEVAFNYNGFVDSTDVSNH